MAIDPEQLRLLLAQQQAANAPAPQVQGGNGIDQLTQSQAQPVQSQPGPIKSFLSSFLYGAGQGLLAHNGMETDAQKQQRLANQQVQQSNAAANNAYRQALTAASQAQNQEVDWSTLGIPGLQGKGLLKDLPKVIAPYISGQARQGAAQTAADAREAAARIAADAVNNRTNQMFAPLSPYGSKIAHTGGQDTLIDRFGNTIKPLGVSNAMLIPELRARYGAEYRTVPSTDDEGNPINISGLTSLQTGAPTVPFAQARGLQSDVTGLTRFHDIIGQIKSNQSVLNDDVQRGLVAQSISSLANNHDPNAIQAFLRSKVQEGMNPQAAKLVADTLALKEVSPSVRKFTGNLNGTEALYNRYAANQFSAGNNEEVNNQLLSNDEALVQKALNNVHGLTKRGVPVVKSAPATSNEGITEYVRDASGKLVRK